LRRDGTPFTEGECEGQDYLVLCASGALDSTGEANSHPLFQPPMGFVLHKDKKTGAFDNGVFPLAPGNE
jgi:hypothetical protein